MSNIFKLSLFLILIAEVAFGQQFVDKQMQYIRFKNKIINGGFENGTSNWTASGGSFTVSTSAGDFRHGLRGGVFDASAAAQTLTSSSNSLPAGSNQLICYFKTTATDYTLSVFDGTNSVATQTIPATSEFTRLAISYGMAAAGQLRVRITSASNAAALNIDDCSAGEDDSIGTVAQAQFIGSAHFATTASCQWTRTNTAFGAFSTNASCPGPTVDLNPGPGTIQTTDTDLPQITINNLPPGNYEVTASLRSDSGGTGAIAYALNDGTTTDGGISLSPGTSVGANATVVAHFTYTSAGNRTFAVYGAASTSTVLISNASNVATTNFSVKRYPSGSETAFRPDQIPVFIAAEFSGSTNPSLGTGNVASYTEITDANLTLTPVSGSNAVGVMCSTTNAATAPSTGATTCAAGSESVGINFNVPKAGWYQVCFDASHRVETDTAEVVRSTFQIIETPTNAQTLTQECGPKLESGGTGMTVTGGTAAQTNTPGRYCGQCNFTSVGIHGVRLMYEQNVSGTPNESILFADGNTSNGQRVIRATVTQLQPAVASPLIMNSVLTSSSGVTKIEYAKINCSSSSSVTSQSGNWISTIGNVASGACALTLTSGNFSANPVCVATIAETSTGNIFEFEAVSTSTTALSIRNQFVASGSSTVSNGTNTNINVMCMGPR